MDRGKNENGVVAMRLFANWDTDKTSSSAVQRVFNLSVNRLVLNSFPSQVHNIVITARLQGHKRTLRSNEISVAPVRGILDVDLDIDFTVQYPHFLKRKVNCLQILIQRRRRYKNRPIPGGFKTLAIGLVNLTQVLQQGSLREILLWNTEDLQKDSLPSVPSIGRLSLANCQSQPLDVETSVTKEKGLGELSEDSESESEDDPEQVGDSDHQEGTAGSGRHRMRESRIRNKLAHRKNLKQKIVSLLRKFKVPEEEETAFPPSTSASVARAPTAKEIEALFEELDDLSDSGPEGIAADEMSIGSNPRPGLQPYFSRERLPGLPAILDDRNSDSDAEPDDLEWSSDAELQREKRGDAIDERESATGTQTQWTPGSHNPASSASHKGSLGEVAANKLTSVPRTSVQPTLSEKLGASIRGTTLPHSLTAGSIAGGSGIGGAQSTRERRDAGRNASLADHLPSVLSTDPSACLSSSGECLWLCSLPDLPALQTLSTVSSLPLINSPSAQLVKSTLAQLVQKIQNFCNSNSAPPPITWIGVIGNDRLVSQVVRAYVDIVQHKSSSHWLSSLRFALVPPPSSLIGRLLCGIDPQLDNISRDFWERSADMTLSELKTLGDRLQIWPQGASGCVHLPIGEALLQMAEREGQSIDSSRMFVPFLAEVRVGQQDETECESTINSPREREEREREQMQSVASGSPPASPHARHETQEMHVEYWLGSNIQNENLPSMAGTSGGSSQTTPNRKEGKGSLKTTFRTLLITRACAQPLLSLTFVKEKRKEKMLHKLGMKNRQKSEPENPPVQVGNVSRLLCTGTSKHSKLAVSVDGTLYPEVRFFQTSSQWPTHVRTLPVSLLSAVANLNLQ